MVRRNKIWVVLILGLVIGVAVFGGSLGGQFVYDDNIVLANSLLDQLPELPKLFAEPYFEDYPQGGLYRPLTLLSFAFNFIFFGRQPFSFHLVNILLHIGNSLLVFILIEKLSKSFRIAFLAFILFLTLPVHVEAVASIVGRAELLMFLFSVLSILAWLGSKYLWSSVFLLTALLSKETALFLPALMVMLAAFHKTGFRWLKYHLTTAAAYIFLRFYVLGKYAFNAQTEFVFNPLKFAPFFERLATVFEILVRYLEKIFLGLNPSADYSYNQVPVVKNFLVSPLSLMGLVIFFFLSLLIIKYLRRRSHPNLFFSLLIFFLPYLVISNIILPVGTIMADRLMYLPSLGVVFLLAIALDYFIRQNGFPKITLTLFGILVVAYSAAAFSQNKVWQNEKTLFFDMYKKSPRSVVAKTNWAKILYADNRTMAKDLSEEAYRQYPDFLPNLNLLGVMNVKSGNLAEAERLLERASNLRPNHQETLTNLSRLYFREKKYQVAAVVLERLVSLYGGSGNTLLLALSLIKVGDYRQAVNVISQNFGVEPINESARLVLDYANLKPAINISPGRVIKLKELEKKLLDLESSFLDY